MLMTLGDERAVRATYVMGEPAFRAPSGRGCPQSQA